MNKTYQKVKHTQSQHFECYTHMAMIVEPVQHLHTETETKLHNYYQLILIILNLVNLYKLHNIDVCTLLGTCILYVSFTRES